MYDVKRDPEAFLIGPDGRFLAVYVTHKELRTEVE